MIAYLLMSKDSKKLKKEKRKEVKKTVIDRSHWPALFLPPKTNESR